MMQGTILSCLIHFQSETIAVCHQFVKGKRRFAHPLKPYIIRQKSKIAELFSYKVYERDIIVPGSYLRTTNEWQLTALFFHSV